MRVEFSHILTVIIVLMGYLTASLIAWGKLTAQVVALKESLEKTVNRSDLVAAVEAMKSEMYKALVRDRRADGSRGDE